MSRPTQITIDLDALQHNFRQIKKIAPKSAVLAMVKSNAYGHGLERIALALPQAEGLGVACIEEAMQLRKAGVKNPIVLMEGLFCEDELQMAQAENFTLVIHHAGQVEMLEKTRHPVSIWLKVDTGMHRLGFQPLDVPQMYDRLMQCAAVKKPIGLMTHFAESDAMDKTLTARQIAIFNSLKDYPGPRSLSNSGGILAWPEAHGDWVRPGIMLYGASPFGHQQGPDHHLRPVMSLTSSLIAIHNIKKGERVGYGGTWICPEDMRIGVVAIGYGDGYPRHAKNGTPLLVNDERCDLVGRVSMDMLTVDLRTQPQAKIGDPVVLWGNGLPVEQVAEKSDTSCYELLTRITQRVHVVVKNAVDH